MTRRHRPTVINVTTPHSGPVHLVIEEWYIQRPKTRPRHHPPGKRQRRKPVKREAGV